MAFDPDRVSAPDIDRRTMLKLAGATGAVTVAGCTDISGGGGGPHLRATLGSNISNTDPTRINDTTSGKATDLIYETLVFIDFEGRSQPSLATSIDREDDTHFTVNLREDVTFHTGEELTAADVKATFERYEGTPRQADVYDWYDSSEIRDDLTLDLTLSRPYAPLRYALADVEIVPKAYAEQTVTITAEGTATPQERSKLSEVPVGTGPYEFDSWESGSFFRIQRFNDYWFEGSDNMPAEPPIDMVTFRVIQGQTPRASALEAGDVDLINEPPAGQVASYKENEQYTYSGRVEGGFDLIIYPMHPDANTPYQNRKVRQATNRLVPREEIIETVYDGSGTPAYAPISPLSRQYTEDGEEVRFASEAFQQEMRDKYAGYDPDQAADLLEQGFQEAGFEPPFQTTIVTNSDNPQRVDWATLVTEEMNATEYFEVTLETLEFSSYVARLLSPESHTENALFALGWSAGWDPDAYVHNLFHPDQFTPACCNINHYENQAVTTLIEQGLTTYDTETRQQRYRELQRQIVRDSPMAFTRFGLREAVFNNDVVSGFEVYPIDGNFYSAIFEQAAGKHTDLSR